MPNHRAIIEKIYADNQQFYSNSKGQNLLKTLRLVFDEKWLYLFELIQNALDVGADTIRIQSNEDSLIFQHNGKPLEPADVKSLSNVLVSTKSAKTVGFMGIGFKSVFRRFQKVRISDKAGWQFYFCAKVTNDPEFGDQQELIGAVLPKWNKSIIQPNQDFSTRFKFSQRLETHIALAEDLAHVFPEKDSTILALLAFQSLKTLEINNKCWQLEISDEKIHCTAKLNDVLKYEWQLFAVQYTPAEEAVRAFCEHRGISPPEPEREQVYQDVSRKRMVLGILPIESHKVKLPKSGRVYATLPTMATLPFLFHVHADWLLTISRTGLRELEDNIWQNNIIEHITEVVAQVVVWLATTYQERDKLREGYQLLKVPSANENATLSQPFRDEQWKTNLKNLLESKKILPVYSPDSLCFQVPGKAVALPPEFSTLFKESDKVQQYHLHLLFGLPILDRDVLGATGERFFKGLKLVKILEPKQLNNWAMNLAAWWNKLSDIPLNEKRDLLFELWTGISKLAQKQASWAELPCILTQSQKWIAVSATKFFDDFEGRLPSEINTILQDVLPPDDEILYGELWVKLRHSKYSDAKEWVKKYATSIQLKKVIENVIKNAIPFENLIWITQWALSKGLSDWIFDVVVTDKNGQPCVIPFHKALLASPYVSKEPGNARQAVFQGMPVIVPDYLDNDPYKTGAERWRRFFEQKGAKGTLEIEEKKIDDIKQHKQEKVAELLGIEKKSVENANWKGYEILDYSFNAQIKIDKITGFATWLEYEQDELGNKDSRKYASSFYRSEKKTQGTSLADWAQKLQDTAWIPCHNTTAFYCPTDVILVPNSDYEDAPLADISKQLRELLESKGIIFSANVKKTGAMAKLKKRGNELSNNELADLLEAAYSGIGDNHSELQNLINILQNNVTFVHPKPPGNRVPYKRLVKKGGQRSLLGGWILALPDLPNKLGKLLEKIEQDAPNNSFSIPTQTAGYQAFTFLRHVWNEASQSNPLPEKFGEALPYAYEYVLTALESKPELKKKYWDKNIQEDKVYLNVGRSKWVSLNSEPKPAYDDLDDFVRGYLDLQNPIVTKSHLGTDKKKRLQTIDALKIPRLSQAYQFYWETVPYKIDPSKIYVEKQKMWEERFKQITKLLLKTIQDTVNLPEKLTLKACAKINLKINDKTHSHLMALIQENDLYVAGEPDNFVSDAAAAIVKHYHFSRRTQPDPVLLGVHLAALLGALNSENDRFKREINTFVKRFKLALDDDITVPTSEEVAPDNMQDNKPAANTEKPKTPATTFAPQPTQRETYHENGEICSVPTRHQKTLPDDIESSEVRADSQVSKPSPHSSNPTFTQERRENIIQHQADKLRSVLAGEITPESVTDFSVENDTTTGANFRSDEIYREVATRYEEKNGRKVFVGSPTQKGWDLTSEDEKEKRYIEVKGKGKSWQDHEIVEISRAQMLKAAELILQKNKTGIKKESWWLYVVECVGNKHYQVLPIHNPVEQAKYWSLSGAGWRDLADNPQEINLSSYGSVI
jgi:hypothetical protein